MALVLQEPVSTLYKVDFQSGGDTTQQAFWKHMQELERIYGYLKALDLGKVSASDVSSLTGSVSGLNTALNNLKTDLTNHINSSTPHPNYKPSIGWDDLTSKPNLADLSGNLDASRIDNLTTGGGGSGDGITESSMSGNGYAKFGNGLMVQWGVLLDSAATPNYFAFHTPFSSNCYMVNIQTCIPSWANMSSKSYVGNTGSGNPNVNEHEVCISLCDWDKNGFVATVTTNGSSGRVKLNTPVVYIAIGN